MSTKYKFRDTAYFFITLTNGQVQYYRSDLNNTTQSGQWNTLTITVTVPSYTGKIMMAVGGWNPNSGANVDPIWFDNFNLNITPAIPYITYNAKALSVSDYYAFGSPMPGRQFNANVYRYGFNGQEKDNEVAGDGNINTAMFWEYDTRTGRRWNMDPKPLASISEYACFANNPIWFNDPLGDEIDITHRKGFLGLGKEETLKYENGKLFNKDGTEYTGKVKGYLKRVTNALDKIRTGGDSGKELITNLQEKGEIVNIIKTQDGNGFNLIGRTRTVNWNPLNGEGGLDEKGNTRRPGFIGLAHELSHAWDTMDDYNLDNGSWFTYNGKVVRNSEKFATHWENRIRAENHLSLRKYYTQEVHGPAQLLHDNGTSIFYTQQLKIQFNPTEGQPKKLFWPNLREEAIITVPYKYR